MSTQVFIDGEAGTTGLQIYERLAPRADIQLIQLGDDARKDAGARREALNAADVAILCLPDDAAREAVSLIDGDTVVIDASTAHRAVDGWVYGFPEYAEGHRDVLRASQRISNPGCYAITSVAMLHPLVDAGVLPANYPVSINAVSGYSGGGKSLIAAFEDEGVANHTDSTIYAYALGLQHKHIPEITRWGGLAHAPIFVPLVADYYKGMIVQIPLALWHLPGAPTAADLHGALADHYAGERFVTVAPLGEGGDPATLDPEALNDTNELRLYVLHNDKTGQAVVTGVIDNLGKGASGQAVQTLNLIMDADESEGL
ncbi:MAG: N-acetyl-gamma-glutamyl-phosphate reductase [Alphaproteobacteria bacterium]|nr:N-acetyl-gamma-glutamyl-phosphate reductase [Alphaproteobacteria bacterium]|tara:strand:+ start:2869 stop:3813 length:945 start_codon:yes stop_codon:yes gene_type:complete